MGDVTTSVGHAVTHCHLNHAPCKSHDLSPHQVEVARAKAFEHNPDAIELSVPTRRYNCHGYSFAISHGWFNYATRFIADDYDQIPLANARIGDLVIYKNGNTLMHSASIARIEGSTITELHSKWGECALLSHSLTGVPVKYGNAAFALRRRA